MGPAGQPGLPGLPAAGGVRAPPADERVADERVADEQVADEQVAAALVVVLGGRAAVTQSSWRRTRLAALGMSPRYPARSGLTG